MINARQREKVLAEIISDLQHHQSRTRAAPEAPLVEQAIARLREAQKRVREQSPGEASPREE